MLKIYKANVQDLAFIVEAQLLMAKESENLILNKAEVLNGVKYIFDNPNEGHYLIAKKLIDKKDDEYVGCLLVLKEWSDWRNGHVLWIHSVYIQSAYRRQGVFSKMYDYLKNEVLKNDGLRGLRLYVDKTNEKAIKTYEKIGMSKDHYHMYEWLK